jgi:hypothetical protein
MDAATAIQEESENDIFFIFISMQMAVLPVRPFSRTSKPTNVRWDETDALPTAFPLFQGPHFKLIGLS